MSDRHSIAIADLGFSNRIESLSDCNRSRGMNFCNHDRHRVATFFFSFFWVGGGGKARKTIEKRGFLPSRTPKIAGKMAKKALKDVLRNADKFGCEFWA